MKKIIVNEKSLYTIKSEFEKDEIQISSLIYNYQPLIGSFALSLYMFLQIEAENKTLSSKFIPMDRMMALLDVQDTQKINTAFNVLELIDLISLFKDKKDESKLTILLHKAKSNVEFENSNKLKNLLEAKIGKINLDLNISSFKKGNFDISNLERVTDERELNLDEDNLNKNEQSLSTNLDFDHLIDELKIQHKIDFKEIKINEFKKLIASTFDDYKISISDIKKIILQLNKKNTINEESFLKILNDNFKKKEIQLDDFFDKQNVEKQKNKVFKNLKPENFIELRTNLLPNKNEKNLISFLTKNYNFDYFIINVLLDFSLLKNKNKININYIKKIAKTIFEKNINNSSELIKYLKKAHKISVKLASSKNNSNNSEEIDEDLLKLII